MRRMTIWQAGLLTAVALLTPGPATAQGLSYAPPGDHVLPFPLYSTRPEDGGLFLAGSYVMYHQTNPLRQQTIAYAGLIDVDGSVTSGRDPRRFRDQFSGNGGPGTFVGSQRNILDVNQVRGPSTYEPGFQFAIGYKFENGSTLTVDYMYLFSAQYNAAATSAARDLRVGPDLADSFVTAFVYNFPNNFAGPARKTGPGIGNDFALYGIWNGASIMTLQYRQFAQQIQAIYRQPVYETEEYRLSGIVGPRFFWIYDRFKWTTTSLNDAGASDASDVAVYTNQVSNRMYGAFIGCQNEWYIGHGFACNLDLDAAGLLDVVKEQAKYQLGFRNPQVANKRAIRDYTVVPELEAKVGLNYYIAEGIQLHIDYNFMTFFNTVSSPRPVSFNYGGLDPGYERTTRFFDGFTAGLALIF